MQDFKGQQLEGTQKFSATVEKQGESGPEKSTKISGFSQSVGAGGSTTIGTSGEDRRW